MMRFISCLVLFLCLSTARLLAAVTYYVSPTGNDSAAGTTTAAPWRTVAHVNTATFGSGDSILFQRGGTWREMLVPPASGIYFGAYGSGSRPVISGADLLAGTWTATNASVWSYSLGFYEPTQVWFNGALGSKVASRAGVIGPGQWFYSSGKLYVYSAGNPRTTYTSPGVEATQRDRSLLIQNVGNITVEHLVFTNATYTSIYQAGNVTGYQIYNDLVWQGAPYEGFRVDSGAPQISNSEGLYNGTGLGVGGGTGFTLTNSLLSGNKTDAIEVYGTSGQSQIASSTISGNSTDSANSNTVSNWSASPLTVSNSVLLANPFDPLQHGLLGISDDGTNVYQSPIFAARATPFFVVPYIDDYNNLGVAEAVAAQAANYGCHLSYALNTKLVTPADWKRVSALVAAGHEIVAHTRSHADLANNSVFTIKYNGAAATAKMSINTTAGTLQTFLNGSTVPDLNIPISDSYDSTVHVCSEVTANSAYSCVVQDNQNYFTPLVLANTSLVNIKTAYLAQASAGYLNFEVEGAQSDIQANLPGYTLKSFATPFTSSNVTVENHIRDAGFQSNRNGIFTPDDKPNGNWLFSKLNLYNIGAEWLPDGYDSSKPAGSVAALVEALGAAGGVLGVYSHGYDEFTLSQWQQLFAALQNMGGTCMTVSQATDYVHSHGTLLPDGTRKTWVQLITPHPNFANTVNSPVQGAHNLQ